MIPGPPIIPAPILDRAYNIFRSAPHLGEDASLNIATFIATNQAKLVADFRSSCEARDNQNHLTYSLYMRPNSTDLARAVEFLPNGLALVHFNRVKKGDKAIGESDSNNYKNLRLAVDVDTGTLYLSMTSKKSYIDLTEEGKTLDKLNKIHELAGRVVCKVSEALYPYKNQSNSLKQRITVVYYPSGSLRQTFLREKSYVLQNKKQIVTTLIETIAIFERLRLVHRDFKPHNILMEDKGVPVICDVDPVHDLNSALRNDLNKTSPWFASPEYANAFKIDESAKSSEKIPRQTFPILGTDPTKLRAAITLELGAWSLGTTLYLTFLRDKLGSFPWEQGEVGKIFYALQTLPENWWPKPENPNSLDRLVWGLLQVAPGKRLSAIEALEFLPDIKWN